jgi:hypothetical protein
MESFQNEKMAGTGITAAATFPAAHRQGLSSGGFLTPGPQKTMVTAMNSILTSENYHAIIKTIVTVFSLENKVAVSQSVK